MLPQRVIHPSIHPALKLVIDNSIAKPVTHNKPDEHETPDYLDDIEKVAVLSNN